MLGILGILGCIYVAAIAGAVAIACAAASIGTQVYLADEAEEQAEKALQKQEDAQAEELERQNHMKKLNQERSALATKKAQIQIGGAIAINYIRAKRARNKANWQRHYGKPVQEF